MLVGEMLGPYRIVEKLGEGGMGEVYKARDTRLDRTVAIKVLPPTVASDPDRRARFEREAKTIAGLNHAHICSLYDIGRQGDTDFLVMEHVAGETLSARLQKGPLPLEQALAIATDVADALSAAHRQGVVHRDLKPGNVMLTKSGGVRQGSPQAKLLDFGLAKLRADAPAPSLAASLPTVEPVTGEGIVLGTVPYMAPEQLEGNEADARSDIFSFGALLYEMIAGRRAFDGTSRASVIAAILERDPVPLTSLQPLTPPAVDRLVRQCLAKSPDDRPDTAHDVANELRWMRELSGVGVAASGPGVQPLRRRVLLLVALGLPMIAAGAALAWLLRPVPVPAAPQVMRLSLDIRPAEDLARDGPAPGGTRTSLAWTPDGRALVFVGQRGGVRQLYVRPLDAAEARPLAGTEDALAPAVSPDGHWVAFWAKGAIRKVPVGGGAQYGIGTIDPQGPLRFVTKLRDGEVGHILPASLPGATTFMYTVRKRTWSWRDEQIVAERLDDAKRTLLVKDAADARFVPTGHLVFLRQGKLFAVPFDRERMEARGREMLVLETVAQALTGASSRDLSGAGQFAVSPTGALAWVPGPLVPFPDASLVALDRAGRVTPLPAPVRSYDPIVRVSPDGRRLAVSIQNLDETGLWLYDIDREIITPVNRDGESAVPVWSQDGQQLVFSWLKDGRYGLAVQPADASANPKMFSPGALHPTSLTPDGRHVVAVQPPNVLVASLEGGKANVEPSADASNEQFWPYLSPDGRWLAYGSDRSGRFEIYVRPYPGAGAGTPISVNGGESPAWNPDGREIFFLARGDGAGTMRMMAADFSPGTPPRIGRPRVLFEAVGGGLGPCYPIRCYDVAPDGQRFYTVQVRTPPAPPPVTHINIVLNWTEELKAKVTAR